MGKFINYLKKDLVKTTVIAIILVIFVGGVIFVVGSTYAADSYEIVFNRYEANEVMKTCHTDANGKLDDDCITTISNVCDSWSLDSMYSTGGQTNPIKSSEFANMNFTKDTDYYCVAGSSGTYNMGCYVCKTDNSIMHWAANGNSDSKCSAGYDKSTTIIDEENCVTVIPDSCYVCKNDNNIMKWDNNGDSDSKCSSGYDKSTTITEEENCVVIENPKTGNILMFVVWVIGFVSLFYSSYYFISLKSKK